MKKFLVGVKEVYEQMYEVEAESEDQAKDLVETSLMNDETPGVKIIEDQLDYSATLESEYWNVYEVK